MTKTRLAALSARSDGFDDVDGSPECGVYTQMRGIEQVRVGGGLQRGGGAPGIPFVPPQQVGQDLIFVGRLAPGPHFGGAAGGPHFGRGHHEDLHVRARRDDGADIATVEHGARGLGGKPALIVHQRLADLRNRRHDRGGFGDCRRFQHALVKLGRVERDRGIDRLFDIVGRVTAIEHRLGHRAIDQAGVEMRQPVNRRHLLGDGSLARGCRPVYSDDHRLEHIDMIIGMHVQTDARQE
jgi:hypothetical protein